MAGNTSSVVVEAVDVAPVVEIRRQGGRSTKKNGDLPDSRDRAREVVLKRVIPLFHRAWAEQCTARERLKGEIEGILGVRIEDPYYYLTYRSRPEDLTELLLIRAFGE